MSRLNIMKNNMFVMHPRTLVGAFSPATEKKELCTINMCIYNVSLNTGCTIVKGGLV